MQKYLLSSEKFKRFGFLFQSEVISALIPAKVTGIYILLIGEKIIYVGRSDVCLKTRLLKHELLGVASHFAWELSTNAKHGFHLESFLFHKWQHLNLLNQNHPGKPANCLYSCPFCYLESNSSLKFFIKVIQNEHRNNHGK